VKEFVRDPLVKAKLSFIICVAKSVERFLVLYQTDKPMAPFLGEDFTDILKSCMRRIVKPDVMEKACTSAKLTMVDVNVEGNLQKTLETG